MLFRWVKALFSSPPPKTIMSQRQDVKCAICSHTFPMMFPAKGGKSIERCPLCWRYITASAGPAGPDAKLEEHIPFEAWY